MWCRHSLLAQWLNHFLPVFWCEHFLFASHARIDIFDFLIVKWKIRLTFQCKWSIHRSAERRWKHFVRVLQLICHWVWSVYLILLLNATLCSAALSVIWRVHCFHQSWRTHLILVSAKWSDLTFLRALCTAIIIKITMCAWAFIPWYESLMWF